MILSNPEKLQEIDLILVQGVEGFSANSICQADLPGRNWDVKHLKWIIRLKCLENAKHVLPHGRLMMILPWYKVNNHLQHIPEYGWMNSQNPPKHFKAYEVSGTARFLIT